MAKPPPAPEPLEGVELIFTKDYYRRGDVDPFLTVDFLGARGVNDPARPLPKPLPDTLCPTCKGDKKVTVVGALRTCPRCHGVGWIWGSTGKADPPTAKTKLKNARQDKDAEPLPPPPEEDDA